MDWIKNIHLQRKGSLLFLFLTLLQGALFAQGYLNGSLKADATAPQPVFYDRTQIAVSKSVFRTVYKVLSLHKDLLYQITLTHDRDKSFVTFLIKPAGSNPRQFNFKYNRNETGLILCDSNNLDTSFTMAKRCLYLFSFTDTLRDYPVLHKIKVSDKTEVMLDPLTAIRIKKHNELFRTMLQKDAALRNRFNIIQRKADDENTTLKEYLLPMRDSINARISLLTDSMLSIKAQLQHDSAIAFTDKKSAAAAIKYKGEKKKGEPDGAGLMVKDGNIYKGNFKGGVFISGVELIRTSGFEYCGGYGSFDFRGIGYLHYANGNWLLGSFTQGKLTDGMELNTDKDIGFYFGEMKNKQQAGYGEMISKAGDKYCGVFFNGRLVKGYVRQAKRTESGNYKMENFRQIFISPWVTNDFFGLIPNLSRNLANGN